MDLHCDKSSGSILCSVQSNASGRCKRTVTGHIIIQIANHVVYGRGYCIICWFGFSGTKLWHKEYCFKTHNQFHCYNLFRHISNFAHFHVHLKNGLTLWGNDPESKRIFKLQKKIIRIISNVDQNASCRNLFRDLNIPPTTMFIYKWSYMLYKTKHWKDEVKWWNPWTLYTP